MKNILLIRHGQSEWNKLNLFTGFKNIELSEQGIEEANKAGQNFKNLDIKFNIVFTSELKRAQETAKIILQNLDQWDFLNNEGKIISNINLNERDYGDLTGLNKKETAEKFGEEQVHKWRRGYSDQPPNGESLEDVVRRVTKYFEEVIKNSDVKLATNWITGELFAVLNEKNLEISESPVSSYNLSKLINLIKDGTISGKIAKTVFEEMIDGDKDPQTIVDQKGLKQESDPKALEELINKVIKNNTSKVEEYKSGKEKLFGFFVGQVMKESKGKGNPQLINKILKEKLNG